MYYFIFVICILLKNTDSAVVKSDQILEEVMNFASSEKVTDLFGQSPGFRPKEFGNIRSKSALNDISFELVSNLSDESSEGNKRSKKKSRESSESEDSTEGRNGDNISFKLVQRLNEDNKRSKTTSEPLNDSSESMALESSESNESTETKPLSSRKRNSLKDISFELVPNDNDYSDEGNRRAKQISSSSESMTLSNESEESTESTEKSQIDKYGIIDNDQVFCSWEDVKTRDQMAQKLKTEKCRFSMAHQSIYEGGPNVTMFCTYKTCKLAELNDRLSRAGISPDIPGYVPDWQRNIVGYPNLGNSRGSWLSNLGFGFDERDDEIMYCIHNDWRARNMIAQIEKTSTHCMFARVCHCNLTIFFKT